MGEILKHEAAEDTEIVAYKAPAHRRALAKTAEVIAEVVDLNRTICETIVDFIRRKVDKVLDDRKEINKIRRGTAGGVSSILNSIQRTLRRLRITERAPIHKLPVLLQPTGRDEEAQADILFKGDMNDFFDSRIFVDLPFVDGIEPIAKQAFDKEISTQDLIRYLESPEILEVIVDEILTVEDSRFRSSNLFAGIWSIFKGVSKRLRSLAVRQRKKPVTGEIEEQLTKNLEFVKGSYNPNNIDYTLAKLIKKLREDYANYDIDTWLKCNKGLLMEILLGKKINQEEGPSHISRIVYEIYEKRAKGGQKRLKEFIRLNIPIFLEYEADPGEYPFLKKPFDSAGVQPEPAIILDTEFLAEFFGEVIPRVQSKGDSLSDLRNMIIDAAMERIDEIAPGVRNLIVRQSGMKPSYRLAPLANTDSVKRKITELIKNFTRSLASHVDMAELLSDPTESSPAIEEAYRQCFTDEGELKAWRKEETFYEHLRSMVGVIDMVVEGDLKAIRKERFETIERRLKQCLDGADAILLELDETLGFPGHIRYDNIFGENDYATLVKIAHTAATMQERFAARCKLELAMVDFSVRYLRRTVSQEHDARQLQLRLENSPNGILVSDDIPLRTVRFIDHPAGTVQIIQDDQDDPVKIPEDVQDETDWSKLREARLIPATFGGTYCWLAPVNEEEETRQYIDSKSQVSKALKVIRRDKMRAKDITDITRMTLVVDSNIALEAIRSHIERDYLSFGQAIKTDNRHYGFVRVKTTSNVHRNVASSQDYNALRYVVDMPVKSQSGEDIYLAPIEIRILFVADYVKEKSRFHPASHEKYVKERAKVCARTLRPREVWPGLYKEVCPFTGETGPHPDDPWQRIIMVVKDREDFTTDQAA